MSNFHAILRHIRARRNFLMTHNEVYDYDWGKKVIPILPPALLVLSIYLLSASGFFVFTFLTSRLPSFFPLPHALCHSASNCRRLHFRFPHSTFRIPYNLCPMHHALCSGPHANSPPTVKDPPLSLELSALSLYGFQLWAFLCFSHFRVSHNINKQKEVVHADFCMPWQLGIYHYCLIRVSF